MTDGDFWRMEMRIKDAMNQRQNEYCKWTKAQYAIRIVIICGLAFYIVNEIFKLVK